MYVKGLFNNRKLHQPGGAGADLRRTGSRQRRSAASLDVTEVDVDNPYNPLGFTLNLSTDPMAGGTDYFIGRRPLEGGPRVFDQNVDTWYVGGGFRGDFAGRGT